MSNSKRNDIHRPSAIIPSDYTHEMEFGREWSSYDPDEGVDEEWTNMVEAMDLYEKDGANIHSVEGDLALTILKCDICGARYKFGSMFRHTSGEVISIGHNCADEMSLLYDHNAADMIRKRAAGVRKTILARRRRFAALRNFASMNRELLAALKLDHYITKDIRARVIARPEFKLSEKQTALVLKLVEDAAKPKEANVPAPIEEKRQRITGKVVSLKTYDGDYGSVTKMTVKITTPDGVWLAWGTAPQGLFDLIEEEYRAVYDVYAAADYVGDAPERASLKGCTVSFDARLKQGRDPHFAIFSRPTKSALVAHTTGGGAAA